MKNIDGQKVAEKTYQCGKKLKVGEVAGLLVEALATISEKNPVCQRARKELGEQQYTELTSTIITFFALNLLARTHNSKEFEKMFDECQVETQEA